MSARDRRPLGSTLEISVQPTSFRTAHHTHRPTLLDTQSNDHSLRVEFGIENGEQVLYERAGGKRSSELTFETKKTKGYYQAGDRIARSKTSWQTLVHNHPEFENIPSPVTEIEELKTIGLLTGSLPEYESGLVIVSINRGSGRFDGSVLLRPYVRLTAEQSGEEQSKIFVSEKTVEMRLNGNGGRLNQLFIDYQMIKQLEQPGGGIWFAHVSVTITKEVLSQVGSVFTKAAVGALKQALGMGAKKIAEKYAKKLIAKMGAEYAAKRIVRKLFAKIAKLVAIFESATVVATIAFIKGLSVDLIKQCGGDFSLLVKNSNPSSSTVINQGNGASVTGGDKVTGSSGTLFNFVVDQIDWQHAIASGIAAGVSAGVAQALTAIFEKKIELDLAIDKEVAKTLGQDVLQLEVRQAIQKAMRTKFIDEIATKNLTMIIDSVSEAALAPGVNATNFTSKVSDKLKDKIEERLKQAFGGIPSALLGS